MSIYRFEIFQSPLNKQYYWRFKSANNEIVAQSEGYMAKSSAQHAINVIKREAGAAPNSDLTMSKALGW